MSPNETERLAALREYGVLDSPAEEAFDRITVLAAELFDTPIAVVSLIDEERQWFKSRYGLDAPQTPREYAFCDHTIRSDKVMVVPDATADARFRDNPLVTGAPDIRFYAGAPLRLANGHRVGALCVIDRQARPTLNKRDRRRLETLAGIVVTEMDLRLANQRLTLARRQAEAASEARAEFLANMSHELRTPLTSIIGYAGVMNASPALPEREKGFAGKILNASRSLLAIVNDVLDLARLESGQEEPVELVDAAEVTRAAVDLVALQAREKGLELRLEAPEGLPRIRAAPQRLRQVLLNLLGNAIKFTAEGSVQVRLGADAGHLRIAVADTGPGIPPDRLEQVFERFVQADATIAKRYGGTGLGLAISRRLAERMGGCIELESKVGQGATFTVVLPIPA